MLQVNKHIIIIIYIIIKQYFSANSAFEVTIIYKMRQSSGIPYVLDIFKILK